MKMTHIGIDTGRKTGIAVWDSGIQRFLSIETTTATKAMDRVREYYHGAAGVKVYIEDARLRKMFGKSGHEKWQGAGSIKRDASLWEDFCKENGIDFEMVAPKNNITKMSAEVFRRYSKWEKQTSVHGRDAACLVLGK